MSLQVWLPLVSDKIENQGLANLTFVNTNPDIIKSNINGKIGKCWERTNGDANYVYSKEKVDLTRTQSMFCWINFSSLQASASLTGICGTHRYSACTGMGITLRYKTNTSGYISCNTGDGSDRTYSTYHGNTLLNANTWYHIGFTYDGENIRFYVNGSLDGITNYPNQKVVEDNVLIYNWAFSSGTSIASYTAPYKLNDVRMYDHCLSLAEIKDISRGLVAHYPLKGSSLFSQNQIEVGISDISSSNKSSLVLEQDGSIKITSTYVDSPWGSGFAFKQNLFRVPWGSSYIIEAEVLFPDMKNISIDINNRLSDDSTPGNDNDTTNNRVYKKAYLPNIWSKVIWGSTNTNGSTNPNRKDIYPYDNFGPRAKTLPPTYEWHIRNIRVIVGPFKIEDVSGCNSTADAYNFNANSIEIKQYSRYNSSLAFNGVNTFIDCHRYAMVTDQITVSWWGYMNNWGNYTRAISCTCGGGWNFEPGDNGKLRFPCYIKSLGYKTVHDSIPLSNVTPGWHLFCASYNGTDLKIYRDGQLEELNHVSDSPLPIQYHQRNSIIIGAEASGSSDPAGSFFNGYLSDIRIYSTALSEEDIKKLYQSPTKISKNGTLITNGEFIEC